jgi:hypothetical protein
MLEDRVASDCRRGPRCRHVAILGAAEDGKPVDLKVEGCHATADFAATTCLTLIPTGQSPPSSLPDNTSGDTSADNEAGGHGETLAPNPYVLSNAEGPLDRDELVAIDA